MIEWVMLGGLALLANREDKKAEPQEGPGPIPFPQQGVDFTPPAGEIDFTIPEVQPGAWPFPIPGISQPTFDPRFPPPDPGHLANLIALCQQGDAQACEELQNFGMGPAPAQMGM